MRAPAQPGADGPANLAAAIGVAAAGLGGTHVVINDEIHHAWCVEKRATSGLDAFASPGFGPVGRVVEGRVTPRFAFARPSLELTPQRAAAVALVTAAVGLEPWLLETVEAAGFEALVVAGLGAGHVPPDWVDPLARLAATMPVVLASRIGAGPVHRSTYGFAGSEIDLLGRGLISAGYLSPAKARLLLSLAIGAGLARAAIADLFAAASMH
jgi:L-asparaginase